MAGATANSQEKSLREEGFDLIRDVARTTALFFTLHWQSLVDRHSYSAGAVPGRRAGRRGLVLRTLESPGHVGVAIGVALATGGKIHCLHPFEIGFALIRLLALAEETDVRVVRRHTEMLTLG